jgi:hypothetical protein
VSPKITPAGSAVSWTDARTNPESPTMTLHSFTLITDYRTDQVEFVDALYEAGCDDATPSFDAAHGVTTIDFDREADSLTTAITTAIAQVESAGAQVRRIGPDEYVWAAEIAGRLGLTREYVRLLISGVRGPGGFPAPVAPAARNPLWRWTDVTNWYAGWKGDVELDVERDAIIEAFNGALQQRNALARLEESLAAYITASVRALGVETDLISKTEIEKQSVQR